MRTPTEYDNQTLTGLINAALDRGIIDASQRDKLEALAAELSPAGSRQREETTGIAPGREAHRGFNAITVAYSLGALLVLFALAWFLLERWKVLGPGGVLGVSLLYAAAFAAVGMLLRRRGFDVAGGLAIVLAVAMTPVWTWAILRLTGEIPDPEAWDNALSRYEPYVASRLIILELATIGVALVAVRRVRFFALAAPIAAALAALLLHLGQALGDPRLSWYLGPYYQCVVACAMLAIAYAVERRQPAGEDYAFWVYLAGVVMLFVAYVQVWPHIGRWRHALPLVAAALVTASLYLRRRTLLIAGGVAAFGYLGYLAFDVFRRVVALPITLATLGLLVIVSTVWTQRRFPKLVARVSGDDAAGGKTLPGGALAVIGPLVIALTVMLFAGSEALERTREREWRDAFYQRRARAQSRARPKDDAATRAPAVRPPGDTVGTSRR
jgi:hypothetical protein